MLTRRQKWRRVKVKNINDSLLNKSSDNFNSVAIPSKFESFSFLNVLKCNTSTKIKEKKKGVEFADIVKVVLIPIIKDYKDAKLDNDIWYSKDDYFLFQQQYREELKKSKYNSI